MPIKEQLKNVVERALAPLDLEIKRRSLSPEHNLLGLTEFPIRCILDVGANLGQYARFLSRHFPDAHVISFEPIPQAFEQLKDAGIRHFTPLQVAIGEENRTVAMEEHIRHNSSSSLLRATTMSHAYYPLTKETRLIEVKMMTLDAAVCESGIALEDDILIKIDVQGFEDRVIRGGSEVFARARACILEICLDQLYEGQGTFPGIVTQLADLGFQYAGNMEQSYAGDKHVIFVDAVFARK